MKEAEEIINQGYSPENLQKLNNLFADNDSQTKKQILHKLCENPRMLLFAYGMKINECENNLSD